MIRKLRLKFIAIIALIMCVILVVEIVCINVVTRKIGMMQTESYLSKIALSVQFENINGMPEKNDNKTESDTAKVYSQNYFSNSSAQLNFLSDLKEMPQNNNMPNDDAAFNEDFFGPYEFDPKDPQDNFGYDHWHNDNDPYQPSYDRPQFEKPTQASTEKETEPATKKFSETVNKTTAPTTKQQTKTKSTTVKKNNIPNTTSKTTEKKQDQIKPTEKAKKSEVQTEIVETQPKIIDVTKSDVPKNVEAATEKINEKIKEDTVEKTEQVTELTEITETTETTEVTETSTTEYIENVTQKETPPPPPDGKMPKLDFNDNRDSVTVDYFAIILDKNKEIYRVSNLKDSDSLTETQLEYLAYTAINSDKTSAIVNNYQYYKAEKDYGYVLVYTNKSSENALMRKMLMISIFVTIIAMLILLGIAVILSNWTVKPVKEAFANQKQFISDASHELKTPLTVISANADLLEEEIGQNKWLGYIKGQTERMRTLVYELLDLSRMDSAKEPQKVFTQFSLSEAVTNSALPFESSAFEQNKNLQINIEDNILYIGNEKQIKQLTAIFIDNAIKYSNEKGNIVVTLKKEREKTILEFYNTGCTIKDEEREKIFERFYRSDTSRARQTGGYGLGLAIAKSIIDTHKMKISVDSVENAWIKFTIVM